MALKFLTFVRSNPNPLSGIPILDCMYNFVAELITIRREITQMNDELKADVEKLASFSNFNDQLKDVQENIHGKSVVDKLIH